MVRLTVSLSVKVRQSRVSVTAILNHAQSASRMFTTYSIVELSLNSTHCLALENGLHLKKFINIGIDICFYQNIITRKHIHNQLNSL